MENKNLTLKEQVYKLIQKYSNKEKVIDFIGKDNANIREIKEDFVQTAYIYCISYIYKSYDKNRSSIGTFVFQYLDWSYMIFILMSKHHITFSKARAIINNDRPENKEKARYFYNKCVSLENICDLGYFNDSGDDTVDYLQFGMFKDESIKDNDNVLVDGYIMETFYESVDRYIYNYKSKSKNKERDKYIIISYILGKEYDVGSSNSVTYESLGKKYGITREFVRQIVSGYIKWARNDKKIRTALNR